MSFPFTEIKEGDLRRRIFSGNVPVDELAWHRDAEDRVIRVVESDGWYFQRDDELPIEMRPGDEIMIRRNEWHRVIRRRDSRLILEIRHSPAG